MTDKAVAIQPGSITSAETSMVEYSYSEKALLELAAQSAELKDAEGDNYKVVKKAISPLRTTRTSIEKERKAKKAAIIAAGKTLDSKAAALTNLIVPEEDRLKALITAVDDEKTRIEAERIAAIDAKMELISTADTVDELDAIVVDDSYAEFEQRALLAMSIQRKALVERDELLKLQAAEKAAKEAAQKERERELAAQRQANAIEAKRLEAIQAEQDERDRVAQEKADKEREAQEAIAAENQRKADELAEREREIDRKAQEAADKAKAGEEAKAKAKLEKERAEQAAARVKELQPLADQISDYASNLNLVPVPVITDVAVEPYFNEIYSQFEGVSNQLNELAAMIDDGKI